MPQHRSGAAADGCDCHLFCPTRGIPKLELIGSGRPQTASGGVADDPDCQFWCGRPEFNEHSNRSAGPPADWSRSRDLRLPYIMRFTRGFNEHSNSYLPDSPESGWRPPERPIAFSWTPLLVIHGPRCARIRRSGLEAIPRSPITPGWDIRGTPEVRRALGDEVRPTTAGLEEGWHIPTIGNPVARTATARSRPQAASMKRTGRAPAR